MALSKPQMHSLNAGQHYLVCDIENCERNCQFYCNPCLRRMCETCKDEHLKNPDTRQHEVVLFGKRQRQLPEQKCEKHPTKDVGLLCQHCQIPICSECKTEAHQGHAVVDFYHAYSNYCAVCLDKISEIEEYFLPTTEELQKETKADASKIKKYDGENQNINDGESGIS